MDQTIESITQQCEEMAAILGVDEPVTEEVLHAAVSDSTYAHNLLVCRGNAEYLEYLLANPPRIKSNGFDTLTLLRRATESLVTWARTGFSTVDEPTYRKRLEACSQCPKLHTPPSNRKLLYRIAGVAANDRSVCTMCGCVVTVKARRLTDTCPALDPERPGLNRWGEPLPSEDNQREPLEKPQA